MRLLTTPRGRFKNERGQALPLVVLSLVVLLSFTALAIDIARIWVAQQELQRAVDASALAAGQDLPDSGTAYTAAVNYSGTGGYGNAVGGWGVTPNAPGVTFECATHGPDYTSGSPPTCETDTSSDKCNPTGSNTPVYTSYTGSTPTTCNAVHVTETATVSVPLLSVFTGNVTVSASSTAASRQVTGVPKPLNLEVILDTTGSMSQSCSATVPGISSNPDKLDCAKEGVRTLLSALPYTTVSGTSEADDYVGIDVFPALSTTLTAHTGTSTVNFTGKITNSGTTTTKEKITGVTTNESAYVGDAIAGTGIPTGTTITGTSGSSPNYTVTISNAATSAGTYTFTVTVPGATTYTMPATPPMTPPDEETDCNSDSFGVTYPPWATYTYTSGGTGGIPSADLGSFAPNAYTSPGIVDNYPGYAAVPLLGDYQNADGSLNTSSNLVKSVYWAQCSGAKYPGGGDIYGIKDISGQGSYLAGAITAAQYQLATSTRTTGPTGQPVTNGIIILSDGEINDPGPSSGCSQGNGNHVDGVDPGAAGNITWTSCTPCEDSIQAANAAKAAGTLIFAIAYDDSDTACTDAGSGTGSPASSTCPLKTNGYSGTGAYNGSACGMLQYLATNSTYFATEATAGSLDSAFTQAVNVLSGSSDLIPDCTAAPPGC